MKFRIAYVILIAMDIQFVGVMEIATTIDL